MAVAGAGRRSEREHAAAAGPRAMAKIMPNRQGRNSALTAGHLLEISTRLKRPPIQEGVAAGSRLCKLFWHS
jgi:hypothetical protein